MRSAFSVLKKLSATALSQQLPLRLMLLVIRVLLSSKLLNSLQAYCTPRSEWKSSSVVMGLFFCAILKAGGFLPVPA